MNADKYKMPDHKEHSKECLESCLKQRLKVGVKSDDEMHAFAEAHGMAADEVEEMVYTIAYQALNGLLLKGADVPDREFDRDDLEDGIEHEYEHTEDRELAKAIAKAHLLDDDKYYEKLSQFDKD